jgi:cell division protein FtsL
MCKIARVNKTLIVTAAAACFALSLAIAYVFVADFSQFI